MSTPQLTPPRHRSVWGGTIWRSEQNIRVETKRISDITIQATFSKVSALLQSLPGSGLCFGVKHGRCMQWGADGLEHSGSVFTEEWRHLELLIDSHSAFHIWNRSYLGQMQLTTTTLPCLFLSGDKLENRSSNRNEYHDLLTRSRLPHDNEISRPLKNVIYHYTSL